MWVRGAAGLACSLATAPDRGLKGLEVQGDRGTVRKGRAPERVVQQNLSVALRLLPPARKGREWVVQAAGKREGKSCMWP